MAESLSDLLSWARSVDHGIRLLESSVENVEMQLVELDPHKVMQKFQKIIDDTRTLKISAENDVQQLKAMSSQLKDLISSTERGEMMTIDQDLKSMLSTLFPNEDFVNVESLPVPAIETEHTNVDDGTDNLLQPPLAEAAAISPILNCHDESYAEVEITPGLVSKVPKSSLGTSDFIPSSNSSAYNFFRPMRKITLVFSPGDTPRPEVPVSPIPETSTPPVILQDRTNIDSDRSDPKAVNCETTTEVTVDSPDIVQRPLRPVLSFQLSQP